MKQKQNLINVSLVYGVTEQLFAFSFTVLQEGEEWLGSLDK